MADAISLLALGFEGWGREVLGVDLRLIRTECGLRSFISLGFNIYSEHTLRNDERTYLCIILALIFKDYP